MANAPQNYRGKRRRGRRKSPVPMILLLAAVLLAIIIGVAACNHKKSGQENSQPPESLISESDAPLESSSEDEASSSESAVPVGGEESDVTVSSESSSGSSSAGPNPEKPDDWRLVLVNPKNKLSGDYDVTLANVNASYQLDARIVEDMQAMIAAAKADGYSLQICSAYRSTERSAVLYKNKVNQLKNSGYSDEEAAVEAARWVAPPGTSEHNTGLAADIVSVGYFTKYADLEHDFEKFDEFKWLYENCADYGFILRYPKDKQEITGITYEPWHYRYVGKENARKIMDQKICLEEYLNQH
ncbi:M15 family metallopeptidase [Hydrogenoanaerobacterium sp.]|uniref:M15 family metallopeptidase n=1 Tax=Hydrogenoanaerobacterium sp. TaxID=2953763 RepID=UPI0028A2348B|nr:M15 family metallopeptidase [Hydrogenoanaerobacterium sp.]